MITGHSMSESVNPGDRCLSGLPEEHGVEACTCTQKPFFTASLTILDTSWKTSLDWTFRVTPTYLIPSCLVTELNAESSRQQSSTKRIGRSSKTAWTSWNSSSPAVRFKLVSSKSGIALSSNPRVSLCLKNSCDPKHLVNRSETFSDPARCFIRTTPRSICDRIHKSLISICLDFFGMSTPWINWSADAESDSKRMFTTASGTVSPIPKSKRCNNLATETASCAACCIEYNSLSQLLKEVACCCLATARMRLFSKNITCPLIPFRLLKR